MAVSRHLVGVVLGWAVLCLGVVLLIGSEDSQPTQLLQLPRGGLILAFKPYEPERNVFENFDADGPTLDYEWKQAYDIANEADYASININSGASDKVTEGIPDPMAVSHGLEVPEKVYTQDPPYDPMVVELGEHTLGRPFAEVVPEEAVMGKAYVDVPFDKTLNSIPVANPSRDWEFPDY